VAVSGMTSNGTVIADIPVGVAHDAAGNPNTAGTYSDHTVTYDSTAPVFSAVSPATNTFVNSITTSSDVSYTLSEAITSGSITMTRTGGTADVGSPHVCTLIGTALNTGAHINLDLSNTINSCTVAESLVNGAIYTFTFNGIDTAGNVAVAVTNTGVTFDTIAPTISIGAPSMSYTKAGPVTYTITYADTNFNTSTLIPANITLYTTGTANGIVAVTGTGLTRTVTISSITGDGSLGISIAAGTATDFAGNLALEAGPSTTFTVDNLAPTISIGAPSMSYTKAGPVTYTITYADTNFNTSTLAAANITLYTTGTANGLVAVTGAGLTRTVTISSITGDGTLGITIAAGTASDLAGNLAPAAGPSTTFTVDNLAPTMNIGMPSASITKGGPVTYTITYADTNFNGSTLAPANITLNITGTANGLVAVTGTSITRTVTISSITGDGTLGITIAAGTASDLAGNLAPAAGPSTTFTADSTVPKVDWVTPVTDGQTYFVYDQSVLLGVDASDNVGISKVVFFRWDKDKQVNIEIGNVNNPPYSITFDTSILLPDWNQISAYAYDTVNNYSYNLIWLYHIPTLNVNKKGSGIGTVTSDPAGIDCGSTCSYGFAQDSIVTLRASPMSPFIFIGWSGGGCSGTEPCTLTMNETKSVTATFSNPLRIYLPIIFH
jgi:hypothetical protein